MTVRAFNPSTQEAEAGGSLDFKASPVTKKKKKKKKPKKKKNKKHPKKKKKTPEKPCWEWDVGKDHSNLRVLVD